MKDANSCFHTNMINLLSCFIGISFSVFLKIKGSFIYFVCKIFQKTYLSYPLIRTRTCAYQGVRNNSF